MSLDSVKHFTTFFPIVFLGFIFFGVVSDKIFDRKRNIHDTLFNIAVYLGGGAMQLFAINELQNQIYAGIGFLQLVRLPDSIWLLPAAFLITDFVYYWFHRLEHSVEFLWASHQVHHTSHELNLSTGGRLSWLVAIFGGIAYLPSFLLGFSLNILVVAWSLNMVIFSFAHLANFPKMKYLDAIFSTPSNHRVHHAENPCYIHRNFGATLMIWDRIFGTYAPEQDGVEIIYGCGIRKTSLNPVRANFEPMYEYLKGKILPSAPKVGLSDNDTFSKT